jgi:alpha-tubulin suppressor-like RCC1 family protein
LPIALVTALLLSACTTPFDEALLGTEPCRDECVESCEGQPDGVRCPGGACRAEACCTGCWDGAVCHAGSEDRICGREGGACSACIAPADRCVDRRCAASDPAVLLSCADVHSCAITESSGLFCWGSDFGGTLGTDAVTDDGFAGDPVRVPGTWSRVVAAGGSSEPHTCAIDTAGVMSCWGVNGNAELGTRDGMSHSTPAPIADSHRYMEVAASQAMTCGLRIDGELVCWGYASEPPRFGFPIVDFDEFTSPFGERFQFVAMRHGHSCLIDPVGTLSCAGSNSNGQLGHENGNELAIVAPGSTWDRISVGRDHTCGVARDGALWCWGDNTEGELGREGAGARERERIGADSDWVDVAAGASFTCAVRSDGRLSCWGQNEDGQLGDGTTISRSTPVDVAGRYSAVAAGGDHACAIGLDGVIYCWGNAHGAFGEHVPTAETLQP